MNTKSIKIIDFSPNDYSLGEALVGVETRQLADPQSVGAALSLYFQWPEHHKSLLYFGDELSLPILCELDHDPDETELTVIFVRLIDQALGPLPKSGETARIRFEVFRTCYEMVVKVLGDARDAEPNKWNLATSAPQELTIFKHRRLPRTRLSGRADLLIVRLESRDGSDGSARVVDASVLSVVVESSRDWADGELLNIETAANGKFAAYVERSRNGKTVLRLEHSDGATSGRWFDWYIGIAYQALVPRSTVDLDQLIDLYKETGYLSRYDQGGQEPNSRESILDTWRSLNKTVHVTNADYVAVENGTLVGSSGLVLAFRRCARDIWYLNQLCAKAEPHLLTHSGALYQWRCEYLVGRPEDLDVLARYWSGSRWLERIYTKFSMMRNDVRLVPIRTGRKIFESRPSLEPLASMKVGSWQRRLIDRIDVMAGIDPPHLNLVTSLDAVYACWGEVDLAEIEEMACALVAASGAQSRHIALAVPYGAPLPEGCEPGKTDRVLSFKKESLTDFLVAVDHVIAVTMRKFRENV